MIRLFRIPGRGWSLLAGALALTLILGACSQAAPTPTPAGGAAVAPSSAPLSVKVATVQAGSLASTLGYSGNVLARRQVSVVPKASGRVVKLNVDAGSLVKAGDVLIELERETSAAQVAQAEAGLRAAQARASGLKAGPRPEQVAQVEANLTSARARLAALEAGGRPEQIAQAEANLDVARSRLEQTKNGATAQELEQGRLAVEQSRNSLWAAQTSRDGQCGNKYMPGYVCGAANSQVAGAETAIKAAEARYEQIKNGATTEQIAQAEAAVRAAEGQLALVKQPATENDLKGARAAVVAAEAQLSLAKEPITQHDLEAAEAGVAQARAAVDLAKLQLAEATIKAPFAGVVAQRLVSEGSMAGPASPVLVIISTETEVVVNVEEANLGAIEVGQPATVIATAYPGVEFAATVVSISPTVDVRSRTSQVRLAPRDADGKLRDGMFAQVRLAIAGAEGSGLLVPKAAVVQQGGDSVAYVVADGKVQRRVVTLGASDGERLQIAQGLKAGELVAISGVADLRDGAQVAVAQ